MYAYVINFRLERTHRIIHEIFFSSPIGVNSRPGGCHLTYHIHFQFGGLVLGSLGRAFAFTWEATPKVEEHNSNYFVGCASGSNHLAWIMNKERNC